MFKHVTVRQISIIIGWTFFVGAMEERAPVVLKIDEVQQALRVRVGAGVVDDVQSTAALVQSIAERKIAASLREYTAAIDSVLSGMVGSPWKTRSAIAVTGNGCGVLSILPLEGGACPYIGLFNGSYELPVAPVPAPGAMRHRREARRSKAPCLTHDDVKRALQKKLKRMKDRKGSERYPTEITDEHVEAVKKYVEGEPYNGVFVRKAANAMLNKMLGGSGTDQTRSWAQTSVIEWRCSNGTVYRVDRSHDEYRPRIERVSGRSS